MICIKVFDVVEILLTTRSNCKNQQRKYTRNCNKNFTAYSDYRSFLKVFFKLYLKGVKQQPASVYTIKLKSMFWIVTPSPPHHQFHVTVEKAWGWESRFQVLKCTKLRLRSVIKRLIIWNSTNSSEHCAFALLHKS